jgi:metallophosphoesterase (TIGR00282 family)
MPSFNILFFGDIVGKPGRRALAAKLPALKKKFHPDLVIANVENSAHGYGVTERILIELQEAGVNFFTSGNHVFKNPTDIKKVFHDYPIIRPANYAPGTEGKGYKLIEVNGVKVLIINMMGQVFMKEEFGNPFKEIDKLLKRQVKYHPQVTIIDFHAEATSEKRCFGQFCDGRVSLVIGTHTHIQTADSMLLPKGTGYITDAGMCGLKNSSLGMDFDNILKNFINQTSEPKIIPDHGICVINGIFAKIDIETGKPTEMKRLWEEVEV